MQKNNFRINSKLNAPSNSVECSREQQNKQKEYSKREYSHDLRARSFTLTDSCNARQINGEYANGILKIYTGKRGEAKALFNRSRSNQVMIDFSNKEGPVTGPSVFKFILVKIESDILIGFQTAGV